MTEKSEFCEMRSFDLVIRRAYFKAQIRRNYAKNVVINRSVIYTNFVEHFMPSFKIIGLLVLEKTIFKGSCYL